jgi:hypothetical protein
MDSPTVLCMDDRPQVWELMDQVLAVALKNPTNKRI